MTTYWLVGEKPINNNVQENMSNPPEQNPQVQGQNQTSTRNILNLTGNGAPGNHPLTLSPSHQHSNSTHTGNTVHQNIPGDNVPNHTETGPNAPLLLPTASIPRV